jgi:CheY-like chemotaxis protein
MLTSPTDAPFNRLGQTATERRSKSSCDLYAAIGRAVDDSVSCGVLLSLALDPRLRGLRAAEARAVVEAVRAVIRVVGAGDMVSVRARALDDEVEIAVAVRAAASPPPGDQVREAACAARRAGASLSVSHEDGRLVWRLALFAPPAPPALLLATADAYGRVELTAALKELGYRADAADTGSDMLARLSAEPYAAVVADLDMEEAALRALGDLARASRWPPPVLAYADADRDLSGAALRTAGFAGVIVRPVLEAQVAAALAVAGLQSKRPNS